MTVLLALLASTGCRTATGPDSSAIGILVSQMPGLPEIPEWPEVTWTFEDGLYCLDEHDADKVLDYLENRMPMYRFEMESYGEQMQAVKDGLCSL